MPKKVMPPEIGRDATDEYLRRLSMKPGMSRAILMREVLGDLGYKEHDEVEAGCLQIIAEMQKRAGGDVDEPIPPPQPPIHVSWGGIVPPYDSDS